MLRFLRRVLAARLLPRRNGWQTPYIGHLMVAIQFIHQCVVVVMRHLGRPTGLDDELRGVGKVADISTCTVWASVSCIVTFNPSDTRTISQWKVRVAEGKGFLFFFTRYDYKRRISSMPRLMASSFMGMRW